MEPHTTRKRLQVARKIPCNPQNAAVLLCINLNKLFLAFVFTFPTFLKWPPQSMVNEDHGWWILGMPLHCSVFPPSSPAVSPCGGRDDDESSVDIYDGLDGTSVPSGKFTKKLKFFTIGVSYSCGISRYCRTVVCRGKFCVCWMWKKP